MSETLKQETPETDAAEWTTMKGGVVVYSYVSRRIERDRNRWRRVAEQMQEILDTIASSYPVARGYSDGPCIEKEDMKGIRSALAAFDSLRKEQL